MLRLSLTLFVLQLLLGSSALRLSSAPSSRRTALSQAAAAAAASTAFAHAAWAEPPPAEAVRGHLSELKALLADKENFVTALSDGAPYKLPAQIPFTTFQKLEKTSDPEFMEAAIDYAEAYRGVKDLVKLARLTKQTVAVSTKEPGKPRKETQVRYGDVPDSGLATAKEYAERAADEILGATGAREVGASVALDAAVKYMGTAK
ncbi:hypothetical protein EMIHUDRAFT_461595 [Emiliania huxleyi CCMP1516]|uniref:Uncharacterized protein n=2 Tax=Emiliania huxleyi TaxID=2903 RepID=A0A0D3IU38_EMIH1|nr:hypothetical protein EMIHUDRAFT_461595 [Emiliania huxleyi CCMP1516]EOD14773.1 hypothetical protein EMIHUDRAFT_461595 [Emiliania huxleyi CCMP1516]|eukprot:XP_005767202.1 hypothetical protein EMIHUDRAFT_461595 [Emiliania huxleyi CCMP1516]